MGTKSVVPSKSVKVCIGCGICADCCSHEAITIDKDQGFYVSYIKSNVCKDCGVCIESCLFSHCAFLEYKEPRQAVIAYDLHDGGRTASASGGALTAICLHLLRNGIIKGIVTVRLLEGRFSYFIATTEDELNSCRGSVYCPVYYNDIWERIREFPGNLAFIGTPCWCEAVYNLRHKDTAFAKVILILGIVCGHMPSEKASLNYFRKKGIFVRDLASISELKYRGNGWPGKGCIRTKDDKEVTFEHTDIWSYKDLSSLYSYNYTCLVCSDLWARCADLSFADCWDSNYVKLGKGFSLVLVHTDYGMQLLTMLKKSNTVLHMQETSIAYACATQSLMVRFKKCLSPANRKSLLGSRVNVPYRYIVRSKLLRLCYGLLKRLRYNSMLWRGVNKVSWALMTRGYDLTS